jgi:integrase/recombinase XerD
MTAMIQQATTTPATKETIQVVRNNDIHQLAMIAFQNQLRLLNYSPNTFSSYISWFGIFLRYFPNQRPSKITKDAILQFLLQYRNRPGWSASGQNQLINSIKFFYEKVCRQPALVFDLPRPQKPETLPTVFDEREIAALINAATNLKHKTILCLAYAGGLRISEIVSLKITDIDSKRMVINLRQSKGMKDRVIMLSENLLNMFRTYYKMYRPKIYMFEGQAGRQYSSRSIGLIMQHCKKKAGITKKGSIHAIRHSFATHLLEGGTDILSIKDLLGHNSLRTTMIYTHVSKKHISKIQSPLDKLLPSEYFNI